MGTINIDGKDYEFKEGETILEVAIRNNINIPHLCFHKDLGPQERCMQCIVEVNGKIVPSCSTKAIDGMKIVTKNEKIDKFRKININLILSRINTKDIVEDEEIFQILKEEELFEKRFSNLPIDETSPAIIRNPNICILCGRCVSVCKSQSVKAIDFAYKSINTLVTTAFISGIDKSICTNCGQCILKCPTGAIKEKEYIKEVEEAINDPEKHVIVQTAPSIRASLGELFGMKPGTLVTGKMVTALKMLGFDKVFDTDLGADLTTIEEAHEFLERLEKNKLPMTTSCCPAWIKFVEHFYPDLIKHVSTCKSPHMMFGAIAKSYYAKIKNINPSKIVVVSIMPCTAKKYESRRNELCNDGNRNVDYVLTTRELAKMIKKKKIDLSSLSESPFDNPLGISSGAGVIYGSTGGVTESVLRTISFLKGVKIGEIEFKEIRNMKGIRTATISLDNKKIRIGIVHGLGNARKVMERIRNGKNEYDFIEIMACPGGCIGGGGQPKVSKGSYHSVLEKRMLALREQDSKMQIREAHRNPIVKKIYTEFLEKPLSKKAHKYLHTRYFKKLPSL